MSASLIFGALTRDEVAAAIAASESIPALADGTPAYLFTAFKQETVLPWRVRNLEGMEPRLTQLRNTAMLWERSTGQWQVTPSDTLSLPASGYFRHGFAALALYHVIAEADHDATLLWFDDLAALESSAPSAAIDCAAPGIVDTVDCAVTMYLTGAAACLETMDLAHVLDTARRAICPD